MKKKRVGAMGGKQTDIAFLTHLTVHPGDSLRQSDERLQLSDGDPPRRLESAFSTGSASDAAANVALA